MHGAALRLPVMCTPRQQQRNAAGTHSVLYIRVAANPTTCLVTSCMLAMLRSAHYPDVCKSFMHLAAISQSDLPASFCSVAATAPGRCCCWCACLSCLSSFPLRWKLWIASDVLISTGVIVDSDFDTPCRPCTRRWCVRECNMQLAGFLLQSKCTCMQSRRLRDG